MTKSKVKDEFLFDLIRTFGYEKGVELYQSAVVTKGDLTAFRTLLAKFDTKIAPQVPMTYRNAYQSAGSLKRTAGTDPS